MSNRWIWVFCLVTLAVWAAGPATLFAKSVEPDEEISGSVKVPSEEAMLAKLAKVSLVDAISAAVKSAPGTAISAELEDEDGFLVYAVEIVGDDNKVLEVKVDAGNKKILKTEVEDDEKEGGKCDGRWKNRRNHSGHKQGGEED